MRPSRDQINLRVAKVIAERSTCLRAQVGAVITVDNRIVSTGYNGATPGQDHCTDEDCNSESHCSNSVHAEANAIAYAAKKGVAIEGGILYCTHSPCIKCTELIIQAGIKKVVYNKPYRATDFGLFNNAGVEINGEDNL